MSGDNSFEQCQCENEESPEEEIGWHKYNNESLQNEDDQNHHFRDNVHKSVEHLGNDGELLSENEVAFGFKVGSP
jgi:hypothetical protein